MDGDVMLALLVGHPAPWVPEDLDRFDRDDGWRVEILDGTLVVGHHPATLASWTPEDLDSLPESNLFEIIDGQLFVNSQPNPLHQTVADELRTVLKTQIPHDLIAIREIDVALMDSLVGPDLSIVKRAEIEWTVNDQQASTAVLVIEVASPTTQRTDRLVKAEKYAEAGIPGYWRVDLDPIRVIAYALRDGVYAELGNWDAGETFEVDEPVRVRFDPAELLP